MAFDPEAYLKNKQQESFDPEAYLRRRQAESFDPKARLSEGGVEFDPEEYLKLKTKETPKTFVEGALTPFGDLYGKSIPKKQAAEDVKKQAAEYLKKTGSSTAIQTAAQDFIDTLTLGNRAEIMAGVQSLFSNKSYKEIRDLNEAIEQLRREDSPIASQVGDLAGFLAPAGLLGVAGRAVKLGIKGTAALVGAGGLLQEGLTAAELAEEGYETAAAGRALSQAALVGGTIGGLAKGIKSLRKGFDVTDPDTAKKILSEIDDVDSEQAARIVKKYEDMRAQFDDEIKTINDLDKDQLLEFEDIILGGKVKKYRYGDMDQALSDYKDMVARRAAVIGEAANVDPATSKYIGMKLMDAQYVGNMIDRRYGTEVMRTMNELSKNYNSALHTAKGLKEQGQKVFDSLGIKNIEDSKRIIKEIETGNIQSPEAQALSEFFNSLRNVGNALYGDEVIKKMDNYVPHYMKSMPEVIAVVRNQIKSATNKSAKDLTLDDLDKIKNNKELMESLQYVGGFGKEKLTDDKTLLTLTKSFGNPAAIQDTIDVAAQSVKQRLAEKVPPALREDDIGKLMGRWIDGVTHDAALRDNIRKLKGVAESLKSTDSLASQYITNYLKDISGGTRGLAGDTNKRMREFATRRYMKALDAEAAGSPRIAAYHRAVAEAPQFAQFLQAQMYPYFLGLRADAVVRNLTQPYLVTVPSIPGGTAYRTKLAMGALLDTARLGYDKKSIDELIKKGWMPPDPTPGSMLALTRGIQQGGKFRKMSRAALEKTNNLAMYMYQQSDVANRVVTLKMGKRLADDILKGNTNAIKYIDQLPPSYRKQAKAELAKENKEGLQDIINDHLIATTQFNYNRVSMSEFGREAGSAFSMFSKWPTAIGADIYDGYDAAGIADEKRRTRLPSGTGKFLQKYMGPFLMLGTANAMISGATGIDVIDSTLGLEEERDPTREVLIGRSLPGASPLQSVMILADPGQAFTPPVIDAFKDIWNGQFNTAFGLVPFGTWGRFMVERLPKYTGEEGQTPQTFLKEEIFE